MGVVQTTILGLILEGIFYGIYCVIFGAYLRIEIKRRNGSKPGLLVYALVANFILCTAYIVANIVSGMLLITASLPGANPSIGFWKSVAYLSDAGNALYTAIDFITQAILIYRCWMMWHRPLAIAFSIFLNLAFLGTALAALITQIIAPGYGSPQGPTLPSWYNPAVVAFFSISLAVNALTTGLIVYKILTVYREMHDSKGRTTYSSGRHPRDLYPILVESGLITFVAQFVQIMLYQLDLIIAFPVVSGAVVMIYGISTTIVLVRVEMGLTYDHVGSNTSR